METADTSMHAGADVLAATALNMDEWINRGQPPHSVIRMSGDEEFREDEYRSLCNAEALIIEFPQFVDGRGFSHASKLRSLGFTGELVAAGEVLPDQWQYLQRCGFDALLNPETASTAANLLRFSQAYQADVLQPLPRFRR